MGGDGRHAATPVGDASAAGLAEHVGRPPGDLAGLDELFHPALDVVLLVVLAALGREHEGAALVTSGSKRLTEALRHADVVLGPSLGDVELAAYDVVADRETSSSTVYHNAIGGQAVELRIKGYDVTTDGEGCGTNQMLVYYAYFYEDDARDDVEGPFPMIIDVE